MKEINPASQVCSIFSRNPVARNMLYLVLVLRTRRVGFCHRPEIPWVSGDAGGTALLILSRRKKASRFLSAGSLFIMKS